jgi:hypothetical protein
MQNSVENKTAEVTLELEKENELLKYKLEIVDNRFV